MRRPPQNSFWATQLKIAAFDWYETTDNGNMWAGRDLLLGSLIHIYRPQQGSMNIYATTIHELAHAVHWDMSSQVLPPFLTVFGQTDLNVCESWAVGVQWFLTRMEYPNYEGRPNDTIYTNLIMDLVDNSSNESFTRGVQAPTDLVENYTMPQIEEALRNKKTFNQWKDSLTDKYENPTENQLHLIFDFWANF